MTRDAQIAISNIGRYLIMLIAESEDACRGARNELARQEARLRELQNRFRETEFVLAEAGMTLSGPVPQKSA